MDMDRLSQSCPSLRFTLGEHQKTEKGLDRGHYQVTLFSVGWDFNLTLSSALCYDVAMSWSLHSHAGIIFTDIFHFWSPHLHVSACWQTRAVRATCHCRGKNTFLTTVSFSRRYPLYPISASQTVFVTLTSVISKGLMKYSKKESQTQLIYIHFCVESATWHI